ncbi:MAG: RnfABCDGE type electron transport complex subunit D [Oscillospiraceae bacterium]|nr:RnfABCDGE type electron transport complex subunit D [Oscillospiraceae bacterium]
MRKLLVTTAPHIHEKISTAKLMGQVCIACLPALIASCLIFGWESLFLTAVSAAACVGFEALWNIIMKKEQTIGDLSAVVTGILLAFNVPVDFPVWMLIIGDLIAIIIVKQLFGGIGFNFANPAIVARIVLALSFTTEMTSYRYPDVGIDALASATPLAAADKMFSTPVVEQLLGTHGGVLGETCAVALLLGGLYLIFSGTISAVIPVSTLATVAVMCLVCGRPDEILLQLLSGGLLLGAFFMATDYVTSPYTSWGKLIYGIGIGVITCLIRFYGTSPEGMSYAILLMNIVTPYINRGIRQRPLGVKRQPRKKEGKPA